MSHFWIVLITERKKSKYRRLFPSILLTFHSQVQLQLCKQSNTVAKQGFRASKDSKSGNFNAIPVFFEVVIWNPKNASTGSENIHKLAKLTIVQHNVLFKNFSSQSVEKSEFEIVIKIHFTSGTSTLNEELKLRKIPLRIPL